MEPQDDVTVVTLIKDLQKQISYLERKIDTLIAQSAGRPSGGPRNYSRPSRGYDEHKRYDKPRAEGYGNKHSSGSGGSYDKRGGEERKFQPKKRPFRPGDKERFGKRRENFRPKFEE